jgi:predicted RNA binding protein YcfA (HicA-like mRNA interferase family)
MSKLPRVSGADTVKALEKAGFRLIRQHGSHLIVRRADPYAQVTAPNHRELDRGTLRAIIRQAGLSVDELTKLL